MLEGMIKYVGTTHYMLMSIYIHIYYIDSFMYCHALNTLTHTDTHWQGYISNIVHGYIHTYLHIYMHTYILVENILFLFFCQYGNETRTFFLGHWSGFDDNCDETFIHWTDAMSQILSYLYKVVVRWEWHVDARMHQTSALGCLNTASRP